MANGDEDEFIKQFHELMKDRERAQKAIAALAMEKVKVESQRDSYLEQAVGLEGIVKEVEVRLKAATEEMAGLKDKERARSQIIDSLQARLDAAEKREAMLDETLRRIGDELDSIAVDTPPLSGTSAETPEETAAQELEKIQKESLEALKADEHETEHTPLFEAPVRRVSKLLPPSRIKDALIGSRCAVIRTLAVAGSAPFLLMASLFVLANYGVYVPFFYDLLAQYWQPWMGSVEMEAAAFIVPIALLSAWFVLCGRVRSVWAAPYGTGEPPLPPEETKPEPETDKIDKMLDEVFGGLDEAAEK